MRLTGLSRLQRPRHPLRPEFTCRWLNQPTTPPTVAFELDYDQGETVPAHHPASAAGRAGPLDEDDLEQDDAEDVEYIVPRDDE